MKQRVGIVSARTCEVAPAQTCLNECEDAFAELLSAAIIPAFEPSIGDRDGEGFDALLFVAISYWQLSRMISATGGLRGRSGPCYAYVFDSFHRYLVDWTRRFPAPLQRFAALGRHELRNLRKLERIFVPTAATLDDQAAFLRVPMTYVPIGVDALGFGSATQERFIEVNGYGRQPPSISNYLADALNVRGGAGLFHHTDHMRISLITDPIRHRRHFWRTLTRSKLALAYAPEAYDPGGRFDCSFVGQRWYESIAAGCVVVGKRPAAPECATLFDWPDALIDLPEQPEDAWIAVQDLLEQPTRLSRVSRRNYREAVLRHDWRHRMISMAPLLNIDIDEQVVSGLTDRVELAASMNIESADC